MTRADRRLLVAAAVLATAVLMLGARRACTRSIHRPESSASAVKFAVEVITPVSNRPI
jgi:hypothetical protein